MFAVPGFRVFFTSSTIYVYQKALVMCQTPESELMSVLWRKKRKNISMRTGTYRENMLEEFFAKIF
jgi:hypothetical protein